MSKIYLQDKITGNEGYFVSFDSNGEIITRQITTPVGTIPLTVYAPEGSTVTVTKTTSYQQLAEPLYYSPSDSNYLIDSNGDTFLVKKGNEYVFYLQELGTWNVTATDGVNTATGSISIDTLKPYDMRLSYFSATINVNLPVITSQEIICTCTHGNIKLVAEDTITGHCSFKVPCTGSWTVIAYEDEDLYSDYDTVNITTDGQQETITLSW